MKTYYKIMWFDGNGLDDEPISWSSKEMYEKYLEKEEPVCIRHAVIDAVEAERAPEDFDYTEDDIQRAIGIITKKGQNK